MAPKVSQAKRSSRNERVLIALIFAALVVAGYYFSQTRQMAMPASVATYVIPALTFAGLIGCFYFLLWPIFSPRREHEQQFCDAIADSTGDALVVMDDKGRAVYANAPFVKLASEAGVSRLIGFDVLYAGYADFAAPIYQLGQAAQEGKSAHRDVRLQAGTSTPFADPEKSKWLRLAVSPMPQNQQGGKTLWRMMEVTQDRLNQEQAFSRLQFIISYFDQAPVGFFSCLPNGDVDYVNATLAGWLGFELAEIQVEKLSLSQLLGEEAARVVTTLAPINSNHRIDRFTLPLKTKSGQMKSFAMINRADFDSDGKPLPARCMVMPPDSLESQAQVPSSSITQFMNAIPIGVAQVDTEGIVTSSNAHFLALSPAFSRGTTLTAAMPPEGVILFAKALEDIKLGGSISQDFDCVLTGPNPRNVHFSLSSKEEDGTVLVFAVDKTESKLLEAQLAQGQKMQAVGQLASGLAHDFNNMLTPIIGFADLLLTKIRPTDPSFQDVNAIKQNANRAAGLVRHLLAFSRKQTISPKVNDLSESMSDLGLLLKRVVGDKVDLSINHGRSLWPVMVDTHQLEQVIVNLASNSRDAMSKGGKLQLSTYNLDEDDSQSVGHNLPKSDYVVIQSTDTGDGIPQAILDKIFDPFFTTKEVGKGTGLGLSMVYGFVKQSGGYIYCDSVEGEGTTFRIFLPRYNGEILVEDTTKVALEDAPRVDFSGRGRILIVEDEDSVRAFASRALTSRGYTVVEANSGEMGLEVIEDDKDGFELILSDVVMPEMDGPTMLRELRKRGVTSKFIFMSGYAEDAFEKNLDPSSNFGFLQKPFALKQLVEKVKEIMG